MKNRGFTLIELLAVIVILSIITLISVPLINGIVEKARRESTISSAYGYLDAFEKQYMINIINDDNNITNGTYNITDLNVKVKGDKPTSGTETILNGNISSAIFCINGYTVIYKNKKAYIESKGCDSISGKKSQLYPDYVPGDLVYFDPVSSDICDSTHTTSNTCYKWRVISVDDDTKKSDIIIQMDHNLINSINWYSSATNTKGPLVALKELEKATSKWKKIKGITYSYDTSSASSNYGVLTCTNGVCKINDGENITSNLKARMITGEEVAAIAMNKGAASDSFAAKWTVASSSSDYFYFSAINKELGSQKTGPENLDLAWLVENTYKYDYSNATQNTYGSYNYGYWTLSPVSNNERGVHLVYYRGYLGITAANEKSRGVRPVITVKKSELGL